MRRTIETLELWRESEQMVVGIRDEHKDVQTLNIHMSKQWETLTSVCQVLRLGFVIARKLEP
jgi:hypothetical protein